MPSAGDLGEPAEPHRLTWAAIILAVIACLVGLAIGQIAALIYQYMLGFFIGVGPGFVRGILSEWFSQLLAGLIAGGLAIYAPSLVFKRANLEIVFYCLATLVVLLTIPSLLFLPPSEPQVVATAGAIVASALGTVVGAYWAQRNRRGLE